MIRSTQEFGDITPEAIGHCIEFGASKINGFFDEPAIRHIQEKGLPHSQAHAAETSKKLDRLWSVFNLSKLPNVQIDVVPVYPIGFVDHPGVHADNTARNGITLLIPYRGPNGRFEAGARPSKPEFPEYVVDYGVGDLMVLAQYVRSVNGEPVQRQQAYHQGVSSEARFLYTVDLHQADVEIDFTQ